MTDDESDTRLRTYGIAWREANDDRPAIDWELVTKPRRTRVWFAVAAVCVAVVAIVVPLVLTAGNSSAGKPVEPIHPSPSPSPSSPEAGAPPGFFALQRNTIVFVNWSGGHIGVRPHGGTAESLGVAADDKTAYGAYAIANCRTDIYKLTRSRMLHRSASSETLSDVVTIAGGMPESNPIRQEMAVSPDGTKLALVVSTLRADNGADNCQGPEQLVVVNLVTHAVRRWNGAKDFEYVGDLQWAPDSRHLAYSPQICCGKRILDTTAAGSSYSHQPPILPTNTRNSPNGPDTYGPVFWWHDELVTTLAGSLLLLNGHGGVGSVVGTNFPWVDSVSSDASGQHLLLASSELTLRWDNGKLTRVPGRWTQPGW